MIRIVAITSALTIAALSVAIAAVKGFAAAPAPCATSCIVAEHTPTPAPAMGGMSGMPMGGDMSMGPHMTLTALRPPQDGDRQRADAIRRDAARDADQIRGLSSRRSRRFQALLAEHPAAALSFHELGQWFGGPRAIRSHASYVAAVRERRAAAINSSAPCTPPRAMRTPDQLNARIPLSIAHWHQHVNMCWGPAGTPASDYFGPNARFGLQGSIATPSACDSAGGRFQPVLFNWMVHVYPFETDQAKIWQVDMPGGMDAKKSMM